VAVVSYYLRKTPAPLSVLAQRRGRLPRLLLSQVQQLSELSFERVEPLSSYGPLIEGLVANLGQLVIVKVELAVFGPRSGDSSEAEPNLVLDADFLFNRGRFFAEAVAGLKLHLLEPFLHVLRDLGLLLRPLVRDVDLRDVFSLPPQTIVVLPDVSQLHVPFLLRLVPHVKHVRLLVLLLPVHADRLSKDGMLGLQLVRHILGRLILIGLFRLLPESAHVGNCRWLLHWVFCCWRRLSLDKRFSFSRRRCCLLALRSFFGFFLFGLLVLGRHGVEHSRGFDFFLVFGEGGDIDGLPFVLVEPFDWVLQLVVKGPPVPSIRLHYPLNHVKGDVEPLLSLFRLFLLGPLHGLPVLLAHLVSDFSLVVALRDESLLLPEPGVEFFEGSYLILARVDLRQIR